MRFLAALLALATLLLVSAPGTAHAACTVLASAPANNSTQSQSPLFRWSGTCTQYRVLFSPSGSFGADTYRTSWRTTTSYRMPEDMWDGYQAGAWASGVYWRVQGADSTGSVNTTSRRVLMDPNLDDDAYSVATGDCDDTNAAVNPGAAEVCNNGLDDDCSGESSACELRGDIDLSAWDRRFRGTAANDKAGSAVEIVGDLDDDGYDDVVVGVQLSDVGGTDGGAVYLGLSNTAAGDVRVDSLEGVVPGTAGDNLGWAVARGGDLDGDGITDLVVSVDAYEATGSVSGSGTVYVWYGPITGSLTLASADATIMGPRSGSEFGFALDARCDYDGDGVHDLLVGAPQDSGNGRSSGSAFVFYGPVTGTLGSASADATFHGEAVDDTLGAKLTCAGDTNGDGYDDALLAADENDEGAADAGAAYLVTGPLSGTTVVSATTTAAKLLGENGGDSAGVGLAGGADLDGDGLDDLVLSAPLNDAAGGSAGKVYVLYGPVSGTIDLSAADLIWTGAAAGDQLGTWVSVVGDINGDLAADLLVGGLRSDAGGTDSGAAWLFYGPLGTGAASISTADARFIGESASDLAGARLSTGGDVNGDGKDDLLIGATGNDAEASGAGAAYLFWGGGR